MDFDPQKIMHDRIAQKLGVQQYAQIMTTVHTTDVSKNTDFQRLFNGYYRVRRDAKWRQSYYALFESMKQQSPTFADILTALYQQTGHIEASFSSKILATLDPCKPIWDSHVLRYLEQSLNGNDPQERLHNAILLYESITTWYTQFFMTAKAKACIDVFDQALPDYRWISKTKKIDFFLWSND